MSLIYKIITQLNAEIPGYNERPLTYADFEDLCQRDGIITFEHKMPARGWYFMMDEQPFIVINRSIFPGHKTFVGFHEYFHHKYHPGGYHYYNAIGVNNKIERQASAIAAVAIIPTKHLEIDIKRGEDISDKYEIPKYLVDFRLKIYDSYRQHQMFEND
jgi:Zn-dependent peptidase ImmA (M78 family)